MTRSDSTEAQQAAHQQADQRGRADRRRGEGEFAAAVVRCDANNPGVQSRGGTALQCSQHQQTSKRRQQKPKGVTQAAGEGGRRAETMPAGETNSPSAAPGLSCPLQSGQPTRLTLDRRADVCSHAPNRESQRPFALRWRSMNKRCVSHKSPRMAGQHLFKLTASSAPTCPLQHNLHTFNTSPTPFPALLTSQDFASAPLHWARIQ
ncbi:hypothetical protein P153DRAFT_122196 [Dothidotthia symphoricarpi CBS 119687]|uniref:Uncharacterized protein n=1 Tax=Dothidotthia symphoricarpi CBS 119687 TaxID=1392245 RepID=A0A6A5ZZK5_9PLEO|nr:uncharacterized protein P153DRAFT_122196 [Dothidotthia symphoricarpi CBS 119687]KAF2125182.1 hypothetical protein P153DRAFT_122196 [Dothidotthia symphoricarpi CBS 119687]